MRRRNAKHNRRRQSPIADPPSHAGKSAAIYYRKDGGYYGECRIGNCRYGTVCHSRAQVREEMRQHRRRVHPDPAIAPADR